MKLGYSGSSSIGGGASVSAPGGMVPVSIEFAGGVGNWYYGFRVLIPQKKMFGKVEMVEGWCEVHLEVLKDLYEEIGKAIQSAPPILTQEEIGAQMSAEYLENKLGNGPECGYLLPKDICDYEQ